MINTYVPYQTTENVGTVLGLFAAEPTYHYPLTFVLFVKIYIWVLKPLSSWTFINFVNKNDDACVYVDIGFTRTCEDKKMDKRQANHICDDKLKVLINLNLHI